MQRLVESFVPAADEVHRLQKGKHAEGRFFRGFSEEGHYGGRVKPTDTRQGIYAVAPSGKFLASVNTTRADRMVKMLESALARWKKIEDVERETAAPVAAALAKVRRVENQFPEDGLVLRVAARDLPGARPQRRWHGEARNQDWAWFKPSEVEAFLPENHADAKAGGERYAVSEKIVMRIVRAHLIDNVRGQTSAYKAKEVRKAELFGELVTRDDESLKLRFRGSSRAQQDEGPWARGLVTELSGEATWDLEAKRFTKFSLLAKGKRWGRTRFNSREERGRRRGRQNRAEAAPATEKDAEPIAILFELLPAAQTQRVAPAHIWVYRW